MIMEMTIKPPIKIEHMREIFDAYCNLIKVVEKHPVKAIETEYFKLEKK